MVATSGLFRASRLQLYGYTVAAIYVLFLVSVYRAGTWILDTKGAPIYTDFACAWAAATGRWLYYTIPPNSSKCRRQ